MSKEQIQKIESQLQEIIDRYKLAEKLSVAMIKSWINNDTDGSAMEAVHLFQKKWLKFFKKVKNIDELNSIMMVFNDAWNYFPHKSLRNKSPDQMVKLSENQKRADIPPKNDSMPKMIVGGYEMSWDDYWAMIKEMEKQQIPFKKWINEDLLVKYKKFLEQSYKKGTIDKHFMVADIFFERVLHVGFVTFDQIRKNFIQQEFPRWWQTHVLMDSLSEREVLSSLNVLFEFIELVYNKDKRKFGF